MGCEKTVPPLPIMPSPLFDEGYREYFYPGKYDAVDINDNKEIVYPIVPKKFRTFRSHVNRTVLINDNKEIVYSIVTK